MANNLELFIRVFFSAFCGYAIGFERETRNKGAGVRTHSLVCLGGALAIIVSKYGFSDIVEYDASRVAAQVVSGIGFIGAGVIFFRRNVLQGLTTAAGLWVTAIIGLALGSGLYVVGFSVTGLVVLAQLIFHKESMMMNKFRVCNLTVEITDHHVLDEIKEIFNQLNISENRISVVKKSSEIYELELEFTYSNEEVKDNFLNILAQNNNILSFKM